MIYQDNKGKAHTPAVEESYLTVHSLQIPNVSGRNTLNHQMSSNITITNLSDNYQTLWTLINTPEVNKVRKKTWTRGKTGQIPTSKIKPPE